MNLLTTFNFQLKRKKERGRKKADNVDQKVFLNPLEDELEPAMLQRFYEHPEARVMFGFENNKER